MVVNQKYIFHNAGGYGYSHMVMIGAMPPTSLWRFALTWQASGSIEGAPGQHLLISFADDPEATWTQPMMIPIQPVNLAVWGPVWHLDDAGVIWLFFSQSTSCRKNAGRGHTKYAPGGDIKYIRSVDGVTWTSAKTIITQSSDQGIPKLVSNQLQVHAGTGNWVLPYWREQPHSKQCRPHADRTVRTSAGVLVSTDRGASWKAIGSWRARGIRWLIEGTVAEVGDKGRLLQLYRSGESTLYKQTSDNGGTSWSPATKTSIPNPNSKVNLIRMTDGDIALAFNDVGGGVRRKLSVAVSSDGSAWNRLQQLEDSTPGLNYAYPTMTQDGCRLLVAYSVTRHGGRQPVSRSGIKLAIITVPTKKESTGGGGRGGGGGGGGERERERGREASVDDPEISLEAPQGDEGNTQEGVAAGDEHELGGEDEEETPIRMSSDDEDEEIGELIPTDNTVP
jgi:predicted neuraminidase